MPENQTNPFTGEPVPENGAENVEVVPVKHDEEQSLVPGGTIDALMKAARLNPRSPEKAVKQAISLATMDMETAWECYYRLERKTKGGKRVAIEGPSIRCAEIAASSWGNIMVGSRPAGHDDKVTRAVGFCHDLEKNVFVAVETERRITTSGGQTYGDDMITVTTNAAAAIARRNAIASVVPRVYINRVWHEAKRVAAGDASTLRDRQNKAVELFAKIGVSEEQILEKVGKQTVQDLTVEDLEKLGGVYGAIRDGATKVDDEFPPVPEQPKDVVGDEEKPDVADGPARPKSKRGRISNKDKLLMAWIARGLTEAELLDALALDSMDQLTPDMAKDAITQIATLERFVRDGGVDNKHKNRDKNDEQDELELE